MHFFLTTRPRSGYSMIIGAGLPSCRLSLIHETHPCDTSHTDTFRDKTLSKKKKKKGAFRELTGMMHYVATNEGNKGTVGGGTKVGTDSRRPKCPDGSGAALPARPSHWHQCLFWSHLLQRCYPYSRTRIAPHHIIIQLQDHAAGPNARQHHSKLTRPHAT